ncbi:MAG: UvrABC system protein [Candidatus Taylorbacteria bacterium]|nr:UvrABC system protein [Candidatus Taylorbacteria bacterium]
MNSQDLLKINMPDAPGVYFFKNSAGDILYIGRATSLRDRVRSYFGDDLIHTRGPLLIDMVTQSAKIDWTETGSVLEAIILEANLIKQHQPYFNTKEKDNRSFNYVVITDEDFPRVLMVRGRNLEAAIADGTLPYEVRESFGPYTNPTMLRDALKIIRRIFPYHDTCVPGSGKPCFNRQLGRCPGVCSGEISQKDYMKTIRRIMLFLRGKTSALTESLERDMKEYASKQEFEKANEAKKTLYALSHIQDIGLLKSEAGIVLGNASEGDEKYIDYSTGSIAGRYRIEAYDIAHLGGNDAVGVMTVVTNGTIDKAEYRKFRVRRAVKKSQKDGGNDDVNNLKEILSRRFARNDWPMPDLVVVDGGIGQINAAEAVLAGFELKIPVVSVVKDETHSPRDLMSSTMASRAITDETLKAAVLLANAESHRFAIAYHKLLRKKSFIKK